MGIKDVSKRWSDTFRATEDAKYKVTYTIEATAIYDGRMLAFCSEEFRYTPVARIPPPICSEDFPGEYMLRTAKISRTSRCTIQIGVVSEEPAVLSASGNASEATTDVQLTLVLLRRYASLQRSDWLPATTCRIISSLRTMTAVLPGSLNQVRPIGHRKVQFGETFFQHSKSHVQTRTVALKDWKANELSLSDGGQKLSLAASQRRLLTRDPQKKQTSKKSSRHTSPYLSPSAAAETDSLPQISNTTSSRDAMPSILRFVWTMRSSSLRR